ncbi:hypothetical protein [Nostoc sp. UHCC 0870]|uniref:hypothetical protein n=1 Tax=Nostoc sp. UHCC 0870 TaxID=2914041 RepID=UPI003FA53010
MSRTGNPFNPPLVGMVVETNIRHRLFIFLVSFNPPLVGMVVETLQLNLYAIANRKTFNPPLVGMVVETAPV